MRVRAVACLIYLLLIGLPSVWAQDGSLVSNYSFILDLGAVSRASFQGRYQVDVKFSHRAPLKTEIETVQTYPDIGEPQTYQQMRLTGDPLRSIAVSIRLLDEQGQPGPVVAQSFSKDGDYVVAQAPQPVPDGGVSTERLLGRLVTPVEFNDAATGRVRVTLEAKQSVLARFQWTDGAPRFSSYARNSPDLLTVMADIVDAKRYDGEIYRYATIVEQGARDPSGAQCGRSGEIRSLRPFLTQDGISLDRAEVCYPAENGAGFERIVVGIHNPSHHLDTSREIWGLTEGVRGGGRVAAKPLYPIDPSRLSEANCFGYALLATRGELLRELPEGGYWISGKAEYLEDGTTPFQTILKSRYKLIKSVPIEKVRMIEKDRTLREGDLVAMFNGTDYDHAGILVRHGAEFWLQSKIGESQIYDSPLDNVGAAHNPVAVEIYRARGERLTKRAEAAIRSSSDQADLLRGSRGAAISARAAALEKSLLQDSR